MKKTLLLITTLLLTAVTFAQKKEKIKGSRIVTVEIKPVATFETLEVSDNLEIYLIKGSSSNVEIDADDNLHSIITINTKGKALYLAASKTVSSSKKFTLRVTYTADLKQIILHDQVKVNTLTDLDLETITFKNYDDTKLFVTSRARNFSLFLDDNSRAEINLKGEKSTLTLSKNSELKALIVSNDVLLDMYQKSDAKVEGDCINLKLRLDNSTRCAAKDLVSKSAEITTELAAKASINAKTAVKIFASGTSEIELYGEPQVTVTKFADSAILKKIQKK